MSGHLCADCWALQPRGRSEWVRAASTLYAALALPRVWHDSGLRSAWLEDVARRHDITAWLDAPQGTEAPADRFGWLAPTVLEAAAADLAARDAAFEESRIPPAARPGGTRQTPAARSTPITSFLDAPPRPPGRTW